MRYECFVSIYCVLNSDKTGDLMLKIGVLTV